MISKKLTSQALTHQILVAHSIARLLRTPTPRTTLGFIHVILLFIIGTANPTECGMSQTFLQPDSNAKGKSTSVWADREGSALLFIESLNVNTDGTPKSYSVEDFW